MIPVGTVPTISMIARRSSGSLIRPRAAARKNPTMIRAQSRRYRKSRAAGGPEVEDREHRHEGGTRLPKVEPDERRDHHRVAERGHGKELCDSLERGQEEDQSGAQHWPEPTSPSRVL